jgi:hypothetical protein
MLTNYERDADKLLNIPCRYKGERAILNHLLCVIDQLGGIEMVKLLNEDTIMLDKNLAAEIGLI